MPAAGPRAVQYIPLSLYELQAWLGTPSIYVFDCNAAGIVVQSFVQFAEQRKQEMARMPAPHGDGPASGPCSGEYILLAPCGVNERLPQEASLPADVFTSCLTTPIKIALRWFLRRSLLAGSVTPDMVDAIPGRQNDRKTPLGELNWIFTAITDTIAWNALPRELFQKLFRQDLLVASLFRNFLLADRIMRTLGCTPVSHPVLPPTHNHPMWQAWDLAAEMCLVQLARAQGGPTAASTASGSQGTHPGAAQYGAAAVPPAAPQFTPSVFFSEQLTAFEVWLSYGSKTSEDPEQLPIVLQVLLSQSHRQRALVLLGRFLDMGPWAVDLALSVGIFPYILKLLQGTELRQELIFIWAKILALDRTCQNELIKDGGHLYFIKFLRHAEAPEKERAMAAFILSVMVDGNARGQTAAVQANLLPICLGLLQRSVDPLLIRWLALCLGKLWGNNPEACALGLREGAPSLLTPLLSNGLPEVRAASVFALGHLIASREGGALAGGNHAASPPVGTSASAGDVQAAKASGGSVPAATGPAPPAPHPLRLATERLIGFELISVAMDAAPTVRAELAAALARLLSGHADAFRALSKKEVQASMLSRAASVPHHLHAIVGSAGSGSTPMSAARSMRRRGEDAMRAASPSPTVSDQPLRATMIVGDDQSRAVAVEGMRAAPSAPGPAAVADGSGSAPDMRDGLRKHEGIGVAAPATGAGAGAIGRAQTRADDTDVGCDVDDEQDNDDSTHGGMVMGEDQVYSEVLAAVVKLARDPAPRVAEVAVAALAAAGTEEVLGPFRRQANAPDPAPTHRRSSSGSGSRWGLTRIASWTSRSKKSVPSTPDSTVRGSNAVGAHLAATLEDEDQSPPISNHTPALGRPGVMIHASPSKSASATPRAVSPSGSAANAGAPHYGTPEIPSLPGAVGMERGGTGNGGAESFAPGELPTTRFYKRSCQYFSRPMLDTSEAMDAHECSMAAIGIGSPPPFVAESTPRSVPRSTAVPPRRAPLPLRRLAGSPVPAPAADATRTQREDWAADCVRRCLDMRPSRLSEQVASLEVQGTSVTALLPDPFSPLIGVGDSAGNVSLWDYQHNAVVNVLHGSTAGLGGSHVPARDGPVDQLLMLNEFDCRLMAAGYANGTVRVWHSATRRNAVRLATAFSALPAVATSTRGSGSPPLAPSPSQHLRKRSSTALASKRFCMDWQQIHGRLFTVGANVDSMFVWDLQSERLAARMPLHTASNPTALCARPARDEVALVGFSDGCVRCFDPRAGVTPVSTSRPHSRTVVAIAAEPGRTHGGHVVTASSAGDISLWDVRNSSAGPLCRIEAHRSAMTAAAVHAHAPLLATASESAHIKVFDLKGSQISCIRYQNSFLGSRIASVGCLAFHPYSGMLVTGSVEPASVSVYTATETH